jgi:6-phosphofructokinase
MANLTTKKNAFYAQSGGVTAVINASACGVIEACRRHKDKIGTLYAGENGIIGALQENLIDTSKELNSAVAALRHTPGGAFGSCRYKMQDIKDSRAEYERLVEVFKAHNIGYFFYNGGGDSADTCLKVSQISAKMGYIAVSTKEASLDIASMAASSTKIFILEVMGRHAGWIAASGGLAAQDQGDAPHIIVFPEIPFNREQFVAKVEQTVNEKGFCVVVASEGASYADGALISGSLNKDAFGHQQLGGVAPTLASMIKHSLGYKYHYALADYLQRAARHIASKTDVDQAYAVGRAAVEKALEGKGSIMITIERGSGKRYSWSLGEAPLTKVANVEKKMPRSFITKDGFGITQKARDYLQPLIAGEDVPPFKNGLPYYPKLKKILVAKKLDTEFKI